MCEGETHSYWVSLFIRLVMETLTCYVSILEELQIHLFYSGKTETLVLGLPRQQPLVSHVARLLRLFLVHHHLIQVIS